MIEKVEPVEQRHAKLALDVVRDAEARFGSEIKINFDAMHVIAQHFARFEHDCRRQTLEALANPSEAVIETVAIALCENALAGKRCPCRESGEFKCDDAYPGQQARAALPAMIKEMGK